MMYQNLSSWSIDKFDPYYKIIFLYKNKLLIGREKYQVTDLDFGGGGHLKLRQFNL